MLQCFQVLSPAHVARGRLFGSLITLKEEWIKTDAGYFEAPGEIVYEDLHQIRSQNISATHCYNTPS